MYAGCVAGALEETDYLHKIASAGFADVEVLSRREIEIPEEALPAGVTSLANAAMGGARLWSITVRGVPGHAS